MYHIFTKTRFTRFMVLAVTLLLSVTTINAKTVYFKNTANWATPTAHMWGNNGGTNWPGTEMTNENNGWFSVEAGDYKNIIFSNNGANQTADLTIPDDKDAYNNGNWETYSPTTEPDPEPEVTWTITGASAIVNGDSWKQDNTANDMTKGDDGIYTLTVTGKALEANNYDYKVVKNHTWGEGEFPSPGNQTLTISEAGTYNIVYTYDGATTLTATASKTGDAPVVTHTWTIAGNTEILNGDNAWDVSNTDNDLTQGEGNIYTLTIESKTIETAKEYEYKVVQDHSWGVSYPSQNAKLTITEVGDYKIVYTFNVDTKELTAVATLLTTPEPETTVTLKGAFDEWGDGLAFTASETEENIYTLSVDELEGEFKVVVNDSWYGSNTAITLGEALPLEIIDGGGNLSFAKKINNAVLTFNVETKSLLVTGTPEPDPISISFDPASGGEFVGSVTVKVTVENAPQDSSVEYNIAVATSSDVEPIAPMDDEPTWAAYDNEVGIVVTESATVNVRVVAGGEVLATNSAEYTVTPAPTPTETEVYIITPENGESYKTNHAIATLTKSADDDNLYTGELAIPGNKLCFSTTLGATESDWEGFNVGRINLNTNVTLIESGVANTFTHGGDGNEYQIRSGFYDVVIDFANNTATFTQKNLPEFQGVFIIGNDGNWETNKSSIKMTKYNDDEYVGIMVVSDAVDGYGFFAVATAVTEAEKDYVTFNSRKLGAPENDYLLPNNTTTPVQSGFDNTFKVIEGNYKVIVNVTNNTITVVKFDDLYLKHPWKTGEDAAWSWKKLIANGDSNYSLTDYYGENGCNWNINDDDNYSVWIPEPILVGEPEMGDKCTFTFNSSEGTVTITKFETTYYIKHPWDGGDWAWARLLRANADGTYSMTGAYGNAGCNINTEASDEGADWEPNPTVLGNPQVGDECTFTYNPQTKEITISKNAVVTGVNDITVDGTKAYKTVENGQVIIVRGDQRFNIVGQPIK